MIDWCNVNAGFVTSILTLVYVVATLITVAIMINANRLNRKATETAVELERQRSRPVIIMEFQRDSIIWTLRIKNAGLSLAQNISFSITPEPKICFSKINAIQDEKTELRLPLFQNGMPSLAPDGEITTALGTLARMKESFGGLRFQGTIKYTDEGGTAYTSPVDIDLSVYESLTYVSRKGLHEIGNEIEKIQKELRLLAIGFHKPRVIIQNYKEYLQEQEEFLNQTQKEFTEIDAKQTADSSSGNL